MLALTTHSYLYSHWCVVIAYYYTSVFILLMPDNWWSWIEETFTFALSIDHMLLNPRFWFWVHRYETLSSFWILWIRLIAAIVMSTGLPQLQTVLRCKVAVVGMYCFTHVYWLHFQQIHVLMYLCIDPIIHIGVDKTGKSSLVQLFHGKPFQTSYNMTVGIDLLISPIKIPNTNYTVELHIFDMSGHAVFTEQKKECVRAHMTSFLFASTSPINVVKTIHSSLYTYFLCISCYICTIGCWCECCDWRLWCNQRRLTLTRR